MRERAHEEKQSVLRPGGKYGDGDAVFPSKGLVSADEIAAAREVGDGGPEERVFVDEMSVANAFFRFLYSLESGYELD